MRGSKSMVIIAAVADPGRGGRRPRLQKSANLFCPTGRLWCCGGAWEFFDATGRVYEFLLTGEKRMTSGANTDSNVTARRARVIDRSARANDIGFVIFWVNACFHRQK